MMVCTTGRYTGHKFFPATNSLPLLFSYWKEFCINATVLCRIVDRNGWGTYGSQAEESGEMDSMRLERSNALETEGF